MLALISGVVQAQYLGISESALDRVGKNYGLPARERVSQWRDLLEASQASLVAGDHERMSEANDFFNLVQWVTDLEQWGREDYWATPIETLATHGGDCEIFP